MALDWTNEPYTRLYKRDTDDDLLLSWEARSVWYEFIKKCDYSGIIPTRRGVRGLAATLRFPLDVVERALAELLEDGRLRSTEDKTGFIAPNYECANFAPRSDKARKVESRIRRRHEALSGEPVTPGHTESHAATNGHTRSLSTEQIIFRLLRSRTRQRRRRRSRSGQRVSSRSQRTGNRPAPSGCQRRREHS